MEAVSDCHTEDVDYAESTQLRSSEAATELKLEAENCSNTTADRRGYLQHGANSFRREAKELSAEHISDINAQANAFKLHENHLVHLAQSEARLTNQEVSELRSELALVKSESQAHGSEHQNAQATLANPN